MTIDLANTLYDYFVWIVSIDLKTSDQLSLKMEVFGKHEIIANFKLEFLFYQWGVRIILSKIMEEWAYV